MSHPLESTPAPLMRWLRCIRYQECIVLQGPPWMGVAFSLETFSQVEIGKFLLFTIASFLLIAHIFCLNDWADITSDAADSHKTTKVFLVGGTSQAEVRNLSVGLGAASLLLFALLPFRTFVLALAVAALGFVYSVSTKGSPVLSSATHLIGGVLHFLMGYSLFGGIDQRGVAIGFFFALTFTAGHLNQEVRDYEADRVSNVLTNAVRFGKTRVFVVAQLIFAMTFAYIVLIALSGFIPARLAPVVLLYPVLLFAAVKTFRAGLTFENVSRFQALYRAIYGIIGVAMVVSLAVQ